MKKIRNNKTISLFLALTLLFGVFSFAAFAAISDAANAFINAVAAIENAKTLESEEAALSAAANALSAYVDAGGSETDAEISEAHAKYLTLKEDIEKRVGYCLDFIEFVNMALDENEAFSVRKENIDKAEELYDKVDPEYKTVSSYQKYYSSLISELDEPIIICETFIAAAKAAAESKTYGEAKRNIRTAEAAKALITIHDYPGLEEAEKNIDTALSMMAMAVYEATPFIQAVKNINKADSIPAGVLAAYAELEGIDQTAEGVYAALTNLKRIENDYNEAAEGGNIVIDEITAITFGIVF